MQRFVLGAETSQTFTLRHVHTDAGGRYEVFLFPVTSNNMNFCLGVTGLLENKVQWGSIKNPSVFVSILKEKCLK